MLTFFTLAAAPLIFLAGIHYERKRAEWAEQERNSVARYVAMRNGGARLRFGQEG